MTEEEFGNTKLYEFVSFWTTVTVLEPNGMEAEYHTEATRQGDQINRDARKLGRQLRASGARILRYELNLRHPVHGTYRMGMILPRE